MQMEPRRMLWAAFAACVLATFAASAPAETANQAGICAKLTVYVLREGSRPTDGRLVGYCAEQWNCPQGQQLVCCNGWKRDLTSKKLRCMKIDPSEDTHLRPEDIDSDPTTRLGSVRRVRDTPGKRDSAQKNDSPQQGPPLANAGHSQVVTSANSDENGVSASSEGGHAAADESKPLPGQTSQEGSVAGSGTASGSGHNSEVMAAPTTTTTTSSHATSDTNGQAANWGLPGRTADNSDSSDASSKGSQAAGSPSTSIDAPGPKLDIVSSTPVPGSNDSTSLGTNPKKSGPSSTGNTGVNGNNQDPPKTGGVLGGGGGSGQLIASHEADAAHVAAPSPPPPPLASSSAATTSNSEREPVPPAKGDHSAVAPTPPGPSTRQTAITGAPKAQLQGIASSTPAGVNPHSGPTASPDQHASSTSHSVPETPLTLTKADLDHGRQEDTIPAPSPPPVVSNTETSVPATASASTTSTTKAPPAASPTTTGPPVSQTQIVSSTHQPPRDTTDNHVPTKPVGPPSGSTTTNIATSTTTNIATSTTTTPQSNIHDGTTTATSVVSPTTAPVSKLPAAATDSKTHEYKVHEKIASDDKSAVGKAADGDSSVTTDKQGGSSGDNCSSAQHGNNCNTTVINVQSLNVTPSPVAKPLGENPHGAKTVPPSSSASKTASEVTISLLLVAAIAFVAALLYWRSRRRRRRYINCGTRDPNLHFTNPVYDLEAMMEQTSLVKLQDAAEIEDGDNDDSDHSGAVQQK